MQKIIIKYGELSKKENDITNYLKKIFESTNINFLIGSGYSAGLLDTLGNIEYILEIVQKKNNDEYKIVEALTLWRFFKRCIYPINDVIANDIGLEQSCNFFKELFNLIENRGNTVYRKKINIFTTNYDPFIEISLEKNKIEYNDGFSGRITPYFCTSNYNRLIKRCTLFSDKESDFPIFNLFKIHGSITWNVNNDTIKYQNIEESNEDFKNTYVTIFEKLENLSNEFSEIESVDEYEIEVMKKKIDDLIEGDIIKNRQSYTEFIKQYKNKFNIVNPTKEKFKDTVFNKTYHELLRIYSNELEKQNSVLFVFGFSFADEHILEITQRALNNPTLQMIIFAYKKQDIDGYIYKFECFNNITIIALDNEIHEEVSATYTSESNSEVCDGKIIGDASINLETLCRIFSSILN